MSTGQANPGRTRSTWVNTDFTNRFGPTRVQSGRSGGRLGPTRIGPSH
jgi:hypothetical protein